MPPEEVKKPKFKIFMPGIILGAVAILAVGSIALALVLRGQGRDIFSGNQMQVYFFHPTEGRLVSESRPWPYGHQLNWVEAAISHLRFPPNSRHLASAWPAINPLLGVEETPFLKNVSIDNDTGTAILEFYESYLDMAPLQEALFRSALTLTLTNLTFIHQVEIRVEDRVFTEDATTIANQPVVSAARLANTQLILYFIDETGEGLVRQFYNAVEIDTMQRARYALEILIHGAGDDTSFSHLSSGIPSETRINAIIPVSVGHTNNVYVNLSTDFLTRFSGGPTQARLTTAAIVNTVLANTTSGRQVFFLIDSAREEHVHGIGDFSGAFEYDDSLLLGFIPNQEAD